MEQKLNKYTHFIEMRAKPLTLKEVLRLRDGIGTSRGRKSGFPYHQQKISGNEEVLLALN